jgi:Flp pilus assembly protein TadD
LVWHNPETFWGDVILKIDNPAETKHVFQELPYLNLATYYRDSGKYEKAFQVYTVLAQHNTDQAEVYRDLGNYYGMHQKFDTSLYFFQKALKIDTNDGTIYNNRGITYANIGKPELALKDFIKAYKLDSTQDGILGQETDMLILLGRAGEAVKILDKLIIKNPKEPAYYDKQGNAYLKGGNFEAAKNDFLKVLDLQDNNGEAMYGLSQAYDFTGDITNATDYANKANQNGFKVPEEWMKKLQNSAPH